MCVEPVEDRTCPHCGTVFRYAELCKLHIKRTCSQQCKCVDCNKEFPTRLELKEHIRDVHKQGSQPRQVADSSPVPVKKVGEQTKHAQCYNLQLVLNQII